MATSKERKNILITWADEIIQNSHIYDRKNGEIISESYNGQIAAFSVSVALSGLKPTMAVYYSEKSSSEVDKTKVDKSEEDKNKVDKSKVVELLADMYNKDKKDNLSPKAFYEKIIGLSPKDEPDMRRVIIEYAIALKLAIRTFKFNKS